MEYYLTMKGMEYEYMLQHRVNLENIWLSEKSQSQKATYYMIHKMFRIGNYIDIESDSSGRG